MSQQRDSLDPTYADGVRQGDRRLLSQAITLVESTRAEDAARAVELLEELAPDAGASLRVGVSGVPGVGKSTLIDALGCRLTGQGKSVAVLAVDPSSALSGGSILGDKTRMTGLANEPNAFIRPSPAAASLGGVARRTREAMLLCEAARFDPVIIETIGVGQSEVAVSHMVDVFVVLVAAGAGDELQGIKRGIFELADLIVVTKADGENERRAAAAAAELGGALKILRGARAPAVMTCSTVSGADLRTATPHNARAIAATGVKIFGFTFLLPILNDIDGVTETGPHVVVIDASRHDVHQHILGSNLRCRDHFALPGIFRLTEPVGPDYKRMHFFGYFSQRWVFAQFI